jgi:hypothetical protein
LNSPVFYLPKAEDDNSNAARVAGGDGHRQIQHNIRRESRKALTAAGVQLSSPVRFLLGRAGIIDRFNVLIEGGEVLFSKKSFKKSSKQCMRFDKPAARRQSHLIFGTTRTNCPGPPQINESHALNEPA